MFGLLLPSPFAQAIYPNADNAADHQSASGAGEIDEYKAKYWSQEPLTEQDYYVQAKRIGFNAAHRAASGLGSNHLAQALNRVETDY